jgi:hypothetical protein
MSLASVFAMTVLDGAVLEAAVRTVALKSAAVPGTPDGTIYNQFYPPVLDAAGHVVFRSGVSASNDTALFSEGPGTLQLLAREGNQVPGAASGINFLQFDAPVVNATGQVAFASRKLFCRPGRHFIEQYWSLVRCIRVLGPRGNRRRATARHGRRRRIRLYAVGTFQ